VLGDRGDDAAAVRHGLRARHILQLLAMRRTEHGSGLGRWRWGERTFAWLNQFRRLRVRYDKRADIHEAFPVTRLHVGLLAVAAPGLDDDLNAHGPNPRGIWPKAGRGSRHFRGWMDKHWATTGE
jgi:hypothetical protein